MIALSPWIIYYITMSDNIIFVLNLVGWFIMTIGMSWFIFTFPLQIDELTDIKASYSYGRAREDDTGNIEKRESAATVKKWSKQRRWAVGVLVIGGILAILAQTIPDKKAVITIVASNQNNRVGFVNSLPPELFKLFIDVYGAKNSDSEFDTSKPRPPSPDEISAGIHMKGKQCK